MKIAYVSRFDPLELASWSGCSYYLARAFDKDDSVSLEFVGPLRHKSSVVFGAKRRIYRMLGKKYLSAVDPVALKDYARQVAEALEATNPDCVLSLDAHPIAYLKTKKPIVYFWDSTFLGNLEYPNFRNIAQESIRYGHQMEQLALETCQLAAFSSEWAVQTAIDGYAVKKEKLRVIPLGANLDCKRTLEEVTRIVESRSTTVCKLLFIGVDWIRKGGDIAYDVVKELNARGLEATLTIVGCQPQATDPLPAYVKSFGYIDKREKRSQAIIEYLLACSHFLIVPSVAEAFGAVFCEASSFGTPSLARRVGGIPAAVRDGINGKLFSREAVASEYCDYILNIFRNYSQYRTLAMSSFMEYESRLSWDRTRETIVKLFRELV
jgi:glycosyltransferase involved in cell wall biosynthesis